MATTLAIRDNAGLQLNDELISRFPALTNEQAGPRTSAKYQLYPSHRIVEQMQAAGLILTEVAQQRSSKRSPLTTQHVMRFAAPMARETFGVGDSIPEVVVMNSHDGKGRFKAFAGVFRFICANGMVVASEMMGSTQVRHFGKANTFDQGQAVIAELPKQVVTVSDRIQAWDGLLLNEAEQRALAVAMIMERQAPEWVSPDLALEIHRDEDAPAQDGSRSLWGTFNVLQENLTTRQLARPEGRTEGRQSPLRPITGAVQGVEYNRKIWTQAEAYFQAAQEAPTQDQRLVEFFQLQAQGRAPEQARKLAAALRNQAEGEARKALARQVDIFRLRANRAKAKQVEPA